MRARRVLLFDPAPSSTLCEWWVGRSDFDLDDGALESTEVLGQPDLTTTGSGATGDLVVPNGPPPNVGDACRKRSADQ